MRKNQQQEKVGKYLTDNAGRWVSYADIAEACGIPLPSARRTTQELMQSGTVRNDAGKYTLDTKKDTNGTWFQALPRAKAMTPEARA